MESKKIDLNSKILIVVPNINDSIIAAAIMNKIIGSRDTDNDCQDIKTVFVDKNALNSLPVHSGIKQIYLIGIGPQNCTDSCLPDFLIANKAKIRLWANNHDQSRIPDEWISAVKKCTDMDPLLFERRPSMVEVLMDKFRPKDIPESWLKAAKNLTNHHGVFPDCLANRFKRAIYSAEVMMQYEDAPGLTATTRHGLMNELLYGSDPKIDEMVGAYMKIKRANEAVLGSVIPLDDDCGLIPRRKQIFNRHKIFGYFLAHLHVLAIQYEDAYGNNLTEIRANKAHTQKLERIAANFENRGFTMSFNGSKLVITYNWEEVQKIIIEEIGR